MAASSLLQSTWRLRAHVAFVAMSVLFLVSFGPFNSVLARYYSIWNTLVLLASACGLLILSVSEIRTRAIEQIGMGIVTLSAVFLVVILLVVCMHGTALAFEPESGRLNVAGVDVREWGGENWKFSALYLFFPVLLMLQYMLLRRVEFGTAARSLAVVAALSASVALYQGLVDSTFLNRWQPWTGRVGGLATDPNAYALTAFLLVPMFVIASVFERDVRWRVFLGLVAFLMLGGTLFAANRTAAGGLLLLVVLAPAIASFAMKEWNGRARLALGAAPIMLVLVAGAIVAMFGSDLARVGPLGERLAQTWMKITHGGLTALLFQSEARGALWSIGWALIVRAPLGGWGPGGFYREYPNELYRQTGEIHPAFDSVLNHYLMMGGDFGLPTLALNVAILLIPILVGIAALGRLRDTRTRLLVATLTAANMIFMLMINTVPPAYFPDVVWVWTMQLGLLVVLRQRAGVALISSTSSVARVRRFTGAAVTVLVLMVAIGAFRTTFGTQGYDARRQAAWWPLRYEKNCYAIEDWGGKKGRWCKNDAYLRVQLADPVPEKIELTLFVGNPDVEAKPVTVRYGGKAGPSSEIVFYDHQKKVAQIPVRQEDIYEFQGPSGPRLRYLVVSLGVSRTWVPKAWKINQDSRELGVAVILP